MSTSPPSTPERLPSPWGRRTPKLKSNSISTAEKVWLFHEIFYHGVSSPEFSGRYGIPRKILNLWVNRFSKNGKVHDACGPKLFDSPAKSELRSSVSGNIHNTVKSEFVHNLQSEHVKAVVKTKAVAGSSVKPISRRSITRYIDAIGLKVGNAEQTTDA